MEGDPGSLLGTIRAIVRNVSKYEVDLQPMDFKQAIDVLKKDSSMDAEACKELEHSGIIRNCGVDECTLITRFAEREAELVGFCDICRSPNPSTDFDCEPFAYTMIMTNSKGDIEETTVIDNGEWGACDECAKLIRAKDLMGLINKAIDANIALGIYSPNTPKELAAAMLKPMLQSLLKTLHKGK